MKRKLLIGAIAILGIVVAPWLVPGTIVVWMYLVWKVWKSKTDIFHDQTEPDSVERHLKRLKTLLQVAGISFAVLIVGVIVHNVLYGLSEIEEPVSFFIALVALWVFTIATISALVVFLKGRRGTTQS